MATKKRLLSPTGLDGNSLTLTNVATPSASSDASTKGYVDTLVPSQTGNTGKYLTTNGTATSWGTIAGGGTVTSITAGTGLSGGVITTSGTIAIDSTIVATLTGTQTLTNKTLTSPTFTAPVLGTPASGTLTNCTFPTLNQNTTGSAGSVANTLTISSPLSGTSYNGSSAVSIGIPVATTSTNGYLSSTDWTTFNNKTSNTGTVTSVSGAGTVSGLTLTGTVTGSGSITLGGTIATLNQNTTGSAGSATYAGYLNTTNQGLTGSTGLTTVSSTTAWSNYPIGYSAMFLAGQTATGAPSSNYGYFIKIANRDAGGGWGGIWTDYSGGDTYVGNTTVSSSYATWYKLLSSTNYNSYAPTLTGTGASGTWGISITGSAGSVPASGLTGSTLASGVTASSLTSVGTLGSLTVSGTISGTGAITQAGNQVLHAGNYNSYAPTLTGGNASGTWGINITGNSATTTNATSSYQLATNTGDVSSSLQYWQLSGNSTLNPDTDWHYALRLSHGSADSYYSATIAISFWTDTIQFRRKQGGVNQNWRTLLTNANFSTYAFPLTGGGLNGDLNLGSNYLRFDQAGTRSWNMRATGGNLDIASGDGSGDLRYQGQRIPKTFVQSGTPSGTIVNGDVWLQHA